MEHITLNLSGGVRRTMAGGRSYLIAPMTMIVPGVLHGSRGPLYYPPEEISRNHQSWNGVPIVVYHPISDNGSHLSASDESILAKQGIGSLRNARIKNNKLIADGWFDEKRTRKIDPRVYDSLINGQKIELSTGLQTENYPAPVGSSHLGKSYTYIAKNYRPDHLAVLPDQVGACSLQDGCGVLVSNQRSKSVVNVWSDAAREASARARALTSKTSSSGMYGSAAHGSSEDAEGATTAEEAAEHHNSADYSHRMQAANLKEQADISGAKKHLKAAKAHALAAKMLDPEGYANNSEWQPVDNAWSDTAREAATASKRAHAKSKSLETTKGARDEHVVAAELHQEAAKKHIAASKTVKSYADQQHHVSQSVAHRSLARYHRETADNDGDPIHNGGPGSGPRPNQEHFDNAHVSIMTRYRVNAKTARNYLMSSHGQQVLAKVASGKSVHESLEEQHKTSKHSHLKTAIRDSSVINNNQPTWEPVVNGGPGSGPRPGQQGPGILDWKKNENGEHISHIVEKHGVSPQVAQKYLDSSHGLHVGEAVNSGYSIHDAMDTQHGNSQKAAKHIKGITVQNRNWSQSKRDKAPASTFAGPHESFPIETQADVDAAVHLIGKADDPEAVKSRIKAIAKQKGLTVPSSWTNNTWTDAAREAAAAARRAHGLHGSDSSSHAMLSSELAEQITRMAARGGSYKEHNNAKEQHMRAANKHKDAAAEAFKNHNHKAVMEHEMAQYHHNTAAADHSKTVIRKIQGGEAGKDGQKPTTNEVWEPVDNAGGNFGHGGRPGQRGGSAAGGGHKEAIEQHVGQFNIAARKIIMGKVSHVKRVHGLFTSKEGVTSGTDLNKLAADVHETLIGRGFTYHKGRTKAERAYYHSDGTAVTLTPHKKSNSVLVQHIGTAIVGNEEWTPVKPCQCAGDCKCSLEKAAKVGADVSHEYLGTKEGANLDKDPKSLFGPNVTNTWSDAARRAAAEARKAREGMKNPAGTGARLAEAWGAVRDRAQTTYATQLREIHDRDQAIAKARDTSVQANKLSASAAKDPSLHAEAYAKHMEALNLHQVAAFKTRKNEKTSAAHDQAAEHHSNQADYHHSMFSSSGSGLHKDRQLSSLNSEKWTPVIA